MDEKHVIIVSADSDGEMFLEFPDDMMESLGWQVGDFIQWSPNKDGSWTLSKDGNIMEAVDGLVETN